MVAILGFEREKLRFGGKKFSLRWQSFWGLVAKNLGLKSEILGFGVWGLGAG